MRPEESQFGIISGLYLSMSNWFEELGGKALAFVDQVADSAINNLNAAQTELEEENTKFREEAMRQGLTMEQGGDIALPWETDDESLAILSQDVMERILNLSMAEANFTEEPKLFGKVEVDFDFQTFVPVAMKLMQLDPNLARMHARLMPRMEEEVFWRNYHYRIQYFRARVGLDGEAMKDGPLGRCKEEDATIHLPDILPPSKVKMSNPPSPNPNDKASATTPSLKGGGSGPNEAKEEELTEEEQEQLALKKRKEEEAALAAEVEAELLNEDIGGIDLNDLDLDADLERELNGEGEDDEDLVGDVDLDDLSDDEDGEAD